jgi:dihydropteroate synthase
MKNRGNVTLMGIVNVTPDSFYDGGRYSTVGSAIEHVRKLQDEGVDIIDIGGASSRPGAQPVSPREELQRVLPVIEAAARFFDGPISIDTTWSTVARAAYDAGATWINDTSAGRFDEGMPQLVAEYDCRVILMHSRGTPQTMQTDPFYKDVVEDVTSELTEAVGRFKAAGVSPDQIILDPGIGFAKTFEHNITLMKHLDAIVAMGYPVVIGTSRKSFIGTITGKNADDRLGGTLATVASAFRAGVSIFRVHDVAETVDFIKVLSAIE